MKLLLIGLCFIPTTIFAQETHREATPEERSVLLASEEEKKLKELGIEASKETERKVIKIALVAQALANGKLDDIQMKGYIQKMTDQGLTSNQIDEEIENLSNQYYAKLQIKNLEKVLPVEKQKQYEKKFTELQTRYEASDFIKQTSTFFFGTPNELLRDYGCSTAYTIFEFIKQ